MLLLIALLATTQTAGGDEVDGQGKAGAWVKLDVDVAVDPAQFATLAVADSAAAARLLSTLDTSTRAKLAEDMVAADVSAASRVLRALELDDAARPPSARPRSHPSPAAGAAKPPTAKHAARPPAAATDTAARTQ